MTRGPVIDVECYTYLELGANRNNDAPGQTWTELDLIGDLTIDSTAETIQMKLWNQPNGFSGVYPTNATHGVTFDAVWQPDSPAYRDLRNAQTAMAPRAFLLLDGERTGLTPRCNRSGAVRGLLGDFYVVAVGQPQPFEGVVGFTCTLSLAIDTNLESSWV